MIIFSSKTHKPVTKRWTTRHILLRFSIGLCVCCSAIALTLPQATALSLNNPGSILIPKPQNISLPTKILTLREAVFLALRQNPDILNTELDMVTDKFALEIAENQFLPQFTLSGGITTNNFKQYDRTVSTGTTLNTPLGTKLSANLDNDLTQHTHTIGANIDQPLLKGFGLQLNRIALEAARDGLITSHLGYRDQVITIIVKVATNYRSLAQAYQNLKNLSWQVKENKNNLKIANIKYKAGRTSLNDLLQSRQSYNNLLFQQTQAKTTAFSQYQDFLRIIGLSPRSKLNINQRLKNKNIKIPNYQKALKIALKDNTNYISKQLSLRAAKRGIISAKDGLKWSLDLKNSTNMGTNLTTTNETSLNLGIPIRPIGAKQELVSAKITLIKAERALAEEKLAIEKTLTSGLQTIKYDRQAITQSKLATALQLRAYRGWQLQWRYGRLSTIDLQQQQETLTTSQQQEVNAEVTYQNKITELFQFLGTTLQKWQVRLRY